MREGVGLAVPVGDGVGVLVGVVEGVPRRSTSLTLSLPSPPCWVVHASNHNRENLFHQRILWHAHMPQPRSVARGRVLGVLTKSDPSPISNILNKIMCGPSDKTTQPSLSRQEATNHQHVDHDSGHFQDHNGQRSAQKK